MRLLETWVATPLAGAVGWTLLHSLWQGAIIAAALAAGVSRSAVTAGTLCRGLCGDARDAGWIRHHVVREMPDSTNRSRAATPAFPAWNVPAVADTASSSSPDLAPPCPGLRRFGWLECGFST